MDGITLEGQIIEMPTRKRSLVIFALVGLSLSATIPHAFSVEMLLNLAAAAATSALLFAVVGLLFLAAAQGRLVRADLDESLWLVAMMAGIMGPTMVLTETVACLRPGIVCTLETVSLGPSFYYQPGIMAAFFVLLIFVLYFGSRFSRWIGLKPRPMFSPYLLFFFPLLLVGGVSFIAPSNEPTVVYTAEWTLLGVGLAAGIEHFGRRFAHVDAGKT